MLPKNTSDDWKVLLSDVEVRQVREISDIPIPIVAKRPEASLHQGTLLSPFYLNFLEIAVVHCLPSFLLAGIATSLLFFLLFHVDIFLSASSNISEVCFDIAQYLTSSSFCNRLFLCHDPLKYCGFTFSS